MKKRKSEINNETSKGKKRFKKKSKKLSEDTEEIEANDFEGELLSAVTIREGMLILGCVVDVKTSVIRMSLPGSLCGFVKIQNISSAFIKALTEFTDDNAVEEPTISSFVHPGMVFPCKVIEISEQTEGKKTSITLSINPEDVNSDLKPRSLYENMVLYVSVTSKEDHGYVVDVGSKCINGFLVDQDVDDKLPVGGVIPTFIKSIIHCDNHLARIQLKKLDCNDIFPEASVCNIKRHSILPGTRIQAVVIKVKHPFIYMKFQNLDVCASILSLQLKKAIEVASTVSGVVLYIHPLTNVIYLTLTSPPTPKSFQKYFDVEKFQSVSHPKYQFIFKNRLYYKVADNTVGFINRRNLPKLSDNESGKKFDSNIDKAAVLKLHYLDKLVQLSVNP